MKATHAWSAEQQDAAEALTVEEFSAGQYGLSASAKWPSSYVVVA